MSNTQKEYKTYDQLCELLSKRHINIGTSSRAINLLKLYGYYPLINGYGKAFTIDNKSDHYKDGTSLEDIYTFYLIDSEFQELFLTSVLKIEKHLETTIGTVVAEKFISDHGNNTDILLDHHNACLTYIEDNNGSCKDYKDTLSPDSYLNYTNYAGKDVHRVLNRINHNIYTCHDDPTKYYKDNHDCIPPWILTQNLSFGSLENYYHIQMPAQKAKIINEMITTPNEQENLDAKQALFYSELELLRQFRNRSAHGKPLYFFRTVIKTKSIGYPSQKYLEYYLGKNISKPNEPKKDIKNNLYGALLGLFLLNRDDMQRDLFLNKLKSLDAKYSTTRQLNTTYKKYLTDAGIPIDYVKRLADVSSQLSKNEQHKIKKSFRDEDGILQTITETHLAHPINDIGSMESVYITSSRSRYHSSIKCPYISKKSTRKIPLLEALENGILLCEYCGQHF